MRQLGTVVEAGICAISIEGSKNNEQTVCCYYNMRAYTVLRESSGMPWLRTSFEAIIVIVRTQSFASEIL